MITDENDVLLLVIEQEFKKGNDIYENSRNKNE